MYSTCFLSHFVYLMKLASLEIITLELSLIDGRKDYIEVFKRGEEYRSASDGPKGGTSGYGYAAHVVRLVLAFVLGVASMPPRRRTEVHWCAGTDRIERLGVAAGRHVVVARCSAAAASARSAYARRARVVSVWVFFLGF